MRPARCRAGLLWPSIGLLGSTLAAAAATRLLDGRPISWWWRAPLPASHGLELNLFWSGVVLLCAAWVGLGTKLGRADGPSPRELTIVGAVWALPLALGPVLFSQDLFSYLAQGSILHHGANPYALSPARALPAWHESGLLRAISSNWRTTTAPYGPVFLWLAGLAGAAAGLGGAAGGLGGAAGGAQLALAAELTRALAVAGLVLLAAFVPRLARRLGADPARAVWLAVCSPLALLYFVGSAHNDALMAGLIVAGVALALDRRPLPGIVLCVVAAAIKLPGALAALAIWIAWLRSEPQRWRQVAGRTAVTVALSVAVIGLLTGAGLRWISVGQFQATANARIAITPATAIAVTIHELGHGVHAGVQQAAAPLEHAAAWIAILLVALLAVWLCARVTNARLVRMVGLVFIAAALGGPEAWPWYLIWGVALLAADPRAQRSAWTAAAALVPALVVLPGGEVAVPLPDAYKLVIVYGAATALAVWAARRRPAASPRSVLRNAAAVGGSLEAT